MEGKLSDKPSLSLGTPDPLPLVIGLNPLDVWQAKAAANWQQDRQKIWVNGGGKTFLVADLIGRSLVAGRPVLVIAPDERRLAALRRALTALELATYSFTYDASPESRRQLAELFRTYKPDKPKAGAGYQPPQLPTQRWRQQVERYRALARPVFDRYPASVVLGLLLEANRKGGEVLLDDQIGTEDFQFSGGEYFEMRDQLEQTQAIFQRLNLREGGLENLHTGIFLHQSETESKQFITEQLTRFSTRAAALYQSYLRVTAQFEKREAQRLAQQELTLRTGTDGIANALAAWQDVGRAERAQSPAWLWFWQRRWGPVARQRREAWKEVRIRWQELRKGHEESGSFTVTDWEMPGDADAIYDRLDRYREQLAQWRARIPEWVRDELTRLNAGTLPTDLLELRPELRRLEQELERLIAAVNESGLYQLPLRADMLTSLRQRKFLEQLLEQFAHTESHLAYYRDFYRWQRHWFGLPARLRRVTRRLLTLPDQDWPALFSSWYFEQGLRRSALPLPAAISDGEAVVAGLRHAERHHIGQQPWITRKASRWKPVPPDDYKTFWRNRPRALLDRFPVWLTTPEGARHLALGNVRFPDLIVENATDLDPADWDFPAERLLVTAATPAPKGYTAIRLEGRHRNGPLQPLFAGGPRTDHPGEVTFCTPANAATCLLDGYRNRSQTPVEKGRIVLTALDDAVWEQLQAAGLPDGIVVRPTELLGCSVDQLLIYGPAAASPGPRIAPRELIDILLSARNRVALYSSAEDEDLAAELITDGTSASFVWAAAVRYWGYRNAGDLPAAEAIASEVHTRLQLGRRGGHPLLREVAAILLDLEDRLVFTYDQPWGMLTLPAIVTLPDERQVVLLVEEVLAEAPPASPAFHWQQIQNLEQAGYGVSRIDTFAWWKDPQAAARALLAEWSGENRQV